MLCRRHAEQASGVRGLRRRWTVAETGAPSESAWQNQRLWPTQATQQSASTAISHQASVPIAVPCSESLPKQVVGGRIVSWWQLSIVEETTAELSTIDRGSTLSGNLVSPCCQKLYELVGSTT